MNWRQMERACAGDSSTSPSATPAGHSDADSRSNAGSAAAADRPMLRLANRPLAPPAALPPALPASSASRSTAASAAAAAAPPPPPRTKHSCASSCAAALRPAAVTEAMSTDGCQERGMPRSSRWNTSLNLQGRERGWGQGTSRSILLDPPCRPCPPLQACMPAAERSSLAPHPQPPPPLPPVLHARQPSVGGLAGVRQQLAARGSRHLRVRLAHLLLGQPIAGHCCVQLAACLGRRASHQLGEAGPQVGGRRLQQRQRSRRGILGRRLLRRAQRRAHVL